MKRISSHTNRIVRVPVTQPKPQSEKQGFFKTSWQIIISGIIISILLFILVNFYVFSSIVSLDSFLFIFLILTLLTDGAFLLIHLVRRPIKPSRYQLDATKISAVIACYNGQDVIGNTIEHLLRQLPKDQIVVVSDASTDNTVKIARSYGVKVLQNPRNMNKAFSISIGVHVVKTPYVLILDDDVLIGDATIPTNLLDEGYSAVAFNVMPIKTDTFVNAIQMFEYRASMYIGKNLRAKATAVGNVSGAIGLYRTDDLRGQAYLHSGQFAGEDEQRTLLSQLYGQGKGVTFSNETVHTHVPNTFFSLYRQRAYGWSLAVPELLPLYMRILFSPRYHYLLKTEKAYNTYIYLTDPLRLLFLWTLLLRPKYLLLTYALYFVLNVLMWVKTSRKDQFLVVLIYPIYTLFLTVCRFIGNFYWLKVKLHYFSRRFHRLVQQRFIVAESLAVLVVFIASWIVSGYNFTQDMKLFNKIRSSRLEEQVQVFDYDNEEPQLLTGVENLNLTFTQTIPKAGTYVSVELEKGDTLRSIAHKTVDKSVENRPEIKIPYEDRITVDQAVQDVITSNGVFLSTATSTLLIDTTLINTAIQQSMEVANEGQ